MFTCVFVAKTVSFSSDMLRNNTTQPCFCLQPGVGIISGDIVVMRTLNFDLS